MKLEQVSVAFPSRKVTNDDILQMVEAASRGWGADIKRVLRKIELGLHISGSCIRYWLDPGETSLEVTLRACRAAIKQSRSDSPIDLIIWASVFGELHEPATSNLVAHELGLENVESIDLKAACDGWMKAIKFADALIQLGMKKRVLVVNGEFSMLPDYAIRPALFCISCEGQLNRRFPIFTIGEAATATILEPDPTNPWSHTNITRNDLYPLCTVTTPWSKGSTSELVGKDGPGLFTSWASELSRAGIPLAIRAFKESTINPAEVKILFTHASSKKDWAEIAGAVDLGEKVYDIHAGYGNLVSASVPAAIALAENEGRLNRGDNVAILVASAGMTFSTAHFVY